MSFGYEQQEKVYVGDNYLIDAFLYDKEGKDLISLVEIDSVSFTVKKPSDPVPSIVNDPGEVVQGEDGHGQYLVPDTFITEPGEYKAVAQFTLVDGRKRSVVVDFDVSDPFQSLDLTGVAGIADHVWDHLDDLFDSELGEAGPWLRSQTLGKFDQEKIKLFVPEAIAKINLLYNPVLNFTVDSFPYEDPNASIVLTHATLVTTIRHLIRSYTEQPDIINSTVGYMDRKRYAEAWARVYELEEKVFRELLAMWKRSMLGLGRPATLVGVKAGRLLPAPLRTRYAARGW